MNMERMNVVMANVVVYYNAGSEVIGKNNYYTWGYFKVIETTRRGT